MCLCWKRGNGSWASPRQEMETTVDAADGGTALSRVLAPPMPSLEVTGPGHVQPLKIMTYKRVASECAVL